MSDALRLVEQALVEKQQAQAQVRQLSAIVATLQGCHEWEPEFHLTSEELQQFGSAELHVRVTGQGVRVEVERG